MTCDIWHLTCYIWHVRDYRWHMTHLYIYICFLSSKMFWIFLVSKLLYTHVERISAVFLAIYMHYKKSNVSPNIIKDESSHKQQCGLNSLRPWHLSIFFQECLPQTDTDEWQQTIPSLLLKHSLKFFACAMCFERLTFIIYSFRWVLFKIGNVFYKLSAAK